VGSRSRRRSPPTARLAAIVLFLVVAGVVTFLVACPPSVPRNVARPPIPEKPSLEPAERPSEAPATPAPARSIPSIRPQHPQPEAGLLAVVIDDAGYSLTELQEFLDLPGPLTIAVLPNLPHSTEAARRVIAAGKDLILHFPMEPMGGENPGPGALLTGQSPVEQEALLAAAFASVPGAIGMNNHMGSRATADPSLMTTVLGYLKRNNLFFLDSRTTAETVGPRLAAQLGVPFLQRDVFVDVDTAASEVDAAFAKGIDDARTRGSAVVIGHVQNPSVAAILRGHLRTLAAQDVRLARLTDVMGKREGDAGR
jgi:hypothetical protein